jgi:striatin 1/3/4
MRFLQIEWHNHERARNAWEIEREEMKQKFSRDEGEIKKLKWQNEFLEKHVKMLESALKAERAKSRALAAGDKSAVEGEAQKEVKAKGASKADAKSGMNAAKRALSFHFTLCLVFTADIVLHSSEQASQLVPEHRGQH